MPKVGDKQFTYDEEGLRAAEIAAELTGEPIIDTESQEEVPVKEAPVVPEELAKTQGEPVIPSYDAGGRVKRIMGYGDGGKVTK